MTRRPYDRAVWRRGVRPAILARDGYRCRVSVMGAPCNRPAAEVGHIVALAEGGAPFSPTNLEAQCRAHNAADGGAIGARRALAGRPSRRW